MFRRTVCVFYFLNNLEKDIMEKNQTLKITYAAACLAISLLLPLVTAQIPELGNMLCPMHIGILLCGIICGWKYGMVIGFITPFLRFVIFGMPPLMPKGISFAFELATYGLIVGLLYARLPKKTKNIYISLAGAMIAGRVVFGIVRFFLASIQGAEFPFSLFITEAFVNAVPGIVLQFVLIPTLIILLKKGNMMPT